MVIKKSFWKSNFKFIRKNINRFLAMLSIVILSTAIISGLLVTAPNMKDTVSENYHNYNTVDINLMIPKVKMLEDVAFNEESISLIKSSNEFLDVEAFNLDESEVLVVGTNKKLNALVYEYNFNNKINKLEIIESIEGFDLNNIKANEVIVERNSYYLEEVEVGTEIEINSNKYTIAAISGNTYYYSKEAEKSLLTNKTFEMIVYKNNSELTFFSNIFLTIDKSAFSNLFSKAYSGLIKEKTKYLEENLIDSVLELRKDDIVNKYPIINRDDLKFNIYILDLDSNLSYASFKNLINKVEQITKIFPIFFLLVSILVILTSMSRMIEEERQYVGVLRSIGYKKLDIYRKYILYAIIIGVFGVGIGYASGFRLIPTIVHQTFRTVFHLPSLNLSIYSMENMIYITFILISIIITTILSVKETLKQNSSELLLPRVPKYGKRIFLERLPKLWNKLKFKYKSSLRNLFRYPKHFVMTILGVTGSLALVFTGISLTSSVDAISKKQYDKIFKYEYDLSVADYNEEALFDYLDKDFEYVKVKEIGDIHTTKKTKENFHITILVFDGDIDKFITLKNRQTKETLTLNDDGVIVTEQIAHYLAIKENDDILFDKTIPMKITGITENYLENYVYMTCSYYEMLEINKEYNNKLFVISNNGDEKTDFTTFNSINNITNLKTMAKEKDRQLNQVKVLAIVIVLAAVFLQVIIIYNLTNVNISERDKELSTLKVLGYTNQEVSKYIYREINIMTIIGIIFGIPLGMLLQRYVVLSVDSPNVMLGRDFGWYSFVASIPLTILMTYIVELIMYFKIKKIDMISALKEL